MPAAKPEKNEDKVSETPVTELKDGVLKVAGEVRDEVRKVATTVDNDVRKDAKSLESDVKQIFNPLWQSGDVRTDGSSSVRVEDVAPIFAYAKDQAQSNPQVAEETPAAPVEQPAVVEEPKPVETPAPQNQENKS